MLNRPLLYLRNAFVVISILVLAGYVAYAWSHYRGVENLRNKAEKRLNIVRAALLTPTDKYRYLPAVIAAYPTISQTLLLKYDSGMIHEGNRFLQKLKTETGLAVIYLLDEHGMTIASSNWQDKDTFVGHNYSFRPYFQDAIKHGEGQFYAMGTISRVPGYYLSRVVKSDDVVLGVLVIKVNMDSLDSLDHVHVRQQSEVTVTDENGIIFLSTVHDWKFRPLIPLDAKAVARVKSTRQYEGVLKAPLRATIERTFSPDEVVMKVKRPAVDQEGSMVGNTVGEAAGNAVSEITDTYLVRSALFSSSPWVVRVFLPMEAINRTAVRVAALSVTMLILLLLVVMYLMETRNLVRERERSRLALQDAHQALEQKHAELEKLSKDLRALSITDALTDAYNRRHFIDMVDKMIAFAKRQDSALAIMMIDIDHFKRVNDAYGHLVGDQVLQLLTTVCQQVLRAEDVFARFGGEEFIMALPATDEHAASQVAERLRTRTMATPFGVNDQEIKITISCGISRYRPDETDINETIKRADEALYEAKSNGRNQVVVKI